MRIRWDSGHSRTHAVRRSLGDDVLEDLLTRSFPGRTSLRVRALTPGFSGASVLHVLPERGGAQHPCVVKVGPSSAISDEYDRWKEYVQPCLGNGEMPDVLSPPVEPVHGRSAVVYKFYASTTLADRLAELDRDDDGTAVEELLASLQQILSVLHQSRERTYLDLLIEEYHLDEGAFDAFEALAGRAWVYGPVDDAQLVRQIWQRSPEPLSGAQLTSNCHGDLHCENVLVGKSGGLGIIDFQHTGKHHYLRDFATLEADLVLRVLCPEDLSVPEATDLAGMLLPYYSTAAFAEAVLRTPPAGPRPALQSALRTLRTTVWGHTNNDVAELPGYLTAVLWRMLRLCTWRDSGLSDLQRWVGSRLVARQAAEVVNSAAGPAVPAPDREPQRLALSGAVSSSGTPFLQVESTAEVAVGKLVEDWRPPPARSPDHDLPAVTAGLTEDLPGRFAHSAVIDALVDAYPEHLTGDRLNSLPNLSMDPTPTIQALNRRLAALPANRLAEFRIVVNHDDQGRFGLVLAPASVTRLLARSPQDAAAINLTLRAAWSDYDLGTYSVALGHFSELAEALASGLELSRSELAMFFYYFSKCLLKLNMYGALERFVEGPYRLFTASCCPELECERLQIAGVLHRHLGDLGSSIACLTDAVEQLEATAGANADQTLWRLVADAHVLQAHPLLDQAVTARGAAVREASLRNATAALRRAKMAYEQYWVVGHASHYEGRLAGTGAFLTVVRSVIEPEAVTAEDWDEAERQARFGFEPEHERKPVGIVAGRAALAAVKLARGHWLRRRAPDGSSPEVRRLLKEAGDELDVAFDRWLPGVELGPRFEYRKLLAVRSSVTALSAGPAAHIDPDALTPLV